VFDLHEAVELCYRRFMLGGPLDRTSQEAVALYAWLASLSASGAALTEAVPFTIPPSAMRPAEGDARRGEGVYQRACGYCHAPRGEEMGRLADRVAVLPRDTEAEHGRSRGYDQAQLETIFVEKTRHGNFLGLSGVMPPFSSELLSDQEMADIVAYLAPQLRD
jgi:mono/diheme cytochrome c family protein